MPSFLESQSWYSFRDKIPFLGAKAILPRCVCADLLFFETFKECIPDSFDVLCSERKPCFSRAVPQRYLRGCLLV